MVLEEKKKKKRETAMQKISSYKVGVSAPDILEGRSDKYESSHESKHGRYLLLTARSGETQI